MSPGESAYESPGRRATGTGVRKGDDDVEKTFQDGRTFIFEQTNYAKK